MPVSRYGASRKAIGRQAIPRSYELCPDANRLLHVHPAAFLAGVALWMVMYSALILLLPRWFALVVAATVTIGHTAGVLSWIWLNCRDYGYQVCCVLCLVPAVLIASTFSSPEPAGATVGKKGVRHLEDSEPDPIFSERCKLLCWGRWALIAILTAITICLFAIPH